MCGKNRLKVPGLAAAALGAGILLGAAFPAGFVLFLTAAVLLAGGLYCFVR